LIYYVIPTAGDIADTFAYAYLQTVPAERVIAVEHNSKTVPCAYNEGLARIPALAEDDIVVFMHDDLRIVDPRFEQKLTASPYAVTGIAGGTNYTFDDYSVKLWPLAAGHNNFRGRILHPNQDKKADVGFFLDQFGPEGSTAVIDGCLMAVRGYVLERLRFTESLTRWYYDYDFSLNAGKAGFSIGALHLAAAHLSHGSGSPERWEGPHFQHLHDPRCFLAICIFTKDVERVRRCLRTLLDVTNPKLPIRIYLGELNASSNTLADIGAWLQQEYPKCLFRLCSGVSSNLIEGHNVLARAACADGARYLMFVSENLDFTESTGLLETTLDTMRGAFAFNMGTVGCVLRHPDGRILHRGYVWCRDSEGAIQIGHKVGDVDTSSGEDPAVLEYVQATSDMFLAVRSDLFIEAGGFPQGYTNDFADIEFNARIGRPNACIISHAATYHQPIADELEQALEADWVKIQHYLQHHTIMG